MSKNALDILREAGTPVEALNDAEREVFAALGPSEVSVLTSIQARINAASNAVVGQLPPDNTNVVC